MTRPLHSRAANRVIRGFSLVVTDRRWAATLSAAALGFGLFVGVAIGPGTAGSFATGAQQVVQIPGLAGGTQAGGAGDGGGGATAALAGPATDPAAGEGGGALASSLPPSAPLAPIASEPLPPAPEATAEPAPPAAEEAEAKPEEDPEAEVLAGTVVHANQAAGSYALAIAGGELVAVHAPKLPAPGTKLKLPLRRLANGTFAEAGTRERRGEVGGAGFDGIVTYVAPTSAAPAYTVSGRGASVLVRVHPDPTGAPPQLPALGSYASVTATIDTAQPVPTLWQSRVEIDPVPPSTYLEVAAIVAAVLPEAKQLLLSADDAGESGGSLTLAVPDGIDAAKLALGDSVLATATVEPDASLTLAGLASDEHSKGADDPKTAQGDLKR